ncbi:MAG TPA: hypothetical protein VFS21_22115 [Roseiflexaceae bacterium]|nr:hypothetical protein [Roseiflexaceae bacterium]
MPDFEQDQTVKTSEGAVLVSADLKPGKDVFELERRFVSDDTGSRDPNDRSTA